MKNLHLCRPGKPITRKPTPKELIRFLEKVEVVDECWKWKNSLNEDKYGRFHFNGKKEYSHRFSYQSFNRFLVGEETVDHKCRNEWCCNPDHLEAKSLSENVVDGNVNRKYAYGDEKIKELMNA